MTDDAIEKRGRGQPPWCPTSEQRAQVKALAAFGIPHLDIATQMGVDRKTLEKHCREELDKGHIEANAKVAKSLYDQAVKEGNVTAQIWWTKARMGWKEQRDPPSAVTVNVGVATLIQAHGVTEAEVQQILEIRRWPEMPAAERLRLLQEQVEATRAEMGDGEGKGG